MILRSVPASPFGRKTRIGAALCGLAGRITIEAADTTVESRSIGTYLEQELNYKERLFVTGALRFDDNSAFGQNFDATVYPKASVSWLVTDKPGSSLNTFRVRAA